MVGDDKFDGEWSYESPGCFSVIDEESCGVWDFKIALNVAIETRPSMSHMAGVLVQVMKLDWEWDWNRTPDRPLAYSDGGEI
tara:strand:- start:1850 stop:2095 length:246 start_codon:yes stop_codon:yes gene_type:complete